ncbi:MAG TPA: hypothetical protein VMG36_06865 [Thermoplasmata archaeon]|nr:hypothetical protein [Thermoplasmata archaeon]
MPDGPRPLISGRTGPAGAVLGATLVLFALTTDLPWVAGFLLAASGIVAALVLRARTAGARSDAAIGIVLLVIGVLAAAAPATAVAGAAGGAAVLAFLAWLADEPGRVVGTVRRGLPAVALAGVAFLVAWASAYLLPRTSAPEGAAAGLIVLAIFLAALLLGRPDLFRREPALTATQAFE